MEEEKLSLLEYIWRNCYQIVVWEREKNHESFPTIFGNGFIMYINGEYIFITADHVIHELDYEKEERTGKEYDYALVNNINGNGISTMFTNISGFYYSESYNFGRFLEGKEELDVALIPYLEDYAVSFIGKELPCPFLTHDLRIDNDIIVKEKLSKLNLNPESVGNPSTSMNYFVMGVLPNQFNGIIWERTNAFYYDIKFEKEEMELYKFRHSCTINEENWSGLSGAPFYDSEGHLVGMLIKVVDGDDIIWVMPIRKILRFINITKQIE